MVNPGAPICKLEIATRKGRPVCLVSMQAHADITMGCFRPCGDEFRMAESSFVRTVPNGGQLKITKEVFIGSQVTSPTRALWQGCRGLVGGMIPRAPLVCEAEHFSKVSNEIESMSLRVVGWRRLQPPGPLVMIPLSMVGRVSSVGFVPLCCTFARYFFLCSRWSTTDAVWPLQLLGRRSHVWVSADERVWCVLRILAIIFGTKTRLRWLVPTNLDNRPSSSVQPPDPILIVKPFVWLGPLVPAPPSPIPSRQVVHDAGTCRFAVCCGCGPSLALCVGRQSD